MPKQYKNKFKKIKKQIKEYYEMHGNKSTKWSKIIK